MPSSPFVIGQWVRGDKFYGRAAQIEEVLEGHRNWLWLLGTRRIGKTSLLKQLEYLTSVSPDSVYFPIFWDFQGADDPEELHRGFSDALLDAEERLEHLGINPRDLEGRDVFDTLGRLRRKLRASNRKLLLLCDEVEELIKLHSKNPALLRKLRRVMQSQEDVRSVLASTIRLWALASQRGDTSPFLHGFTPPIYIDGLNDEESRALVRQVNLDTDSRPGFDEQAVEEIRRRCDNHPYLLQLVCKRYLELQDLDEAVEQVATDQMVSYFFSVDFEMLSMTERDIIRIIAESSSASSDSILDSITIEPGELGGTLVRLEHLGYLRRNQDRRFELVNYFFRRWFREKPHSRLPATSASDTYSMTRTLSDRTTQRLGDGARVFDDRYALLRELGKGATGVVYEAHDRVLGERIALKLLKPEYSSSAEALERFRREILLARDIGHPNIVKIYHLGDCHGQRYLAMKLIEGRTLSRFVASEGPLDMHRAKEISYKLASALEAAHELNVIHRDIKSQNIMIDHRGEPFLTDFGLARLATDPGITQAGVFLGTPDYASPEHVRLLPIDERSDIYSLGVVMFDMVTGRRPFVAAHSRQVLEMHRDTPPPDPIGMNPGIGESFSRIILRCLEKEPERRFQTARDLRGALEEIRET